MLAILAAAAAVAAAASSAYPDWTGPWENISGTLFTVEDGRPNPPPLTPEYAGRYKAVRDAAAAGRSVNDPTARCLWPGVPRIAHNPYPSEYVITPKRVTILYEYMSQIRRIHTDGRPHPAEVEPSFNGHSIGHWEGETLVVDTVGLRDDTMYENTGLPHSDALRVVERIRLIGPDLLENEITMIDPKALTRPWVSRVRYQRRPDWDFLEYVCAENNRNPVDAEGNTLTIGPDGRPLD